MLEVDAVLESSRMSRSHGALQSSLKAAMYLSELAGPCRAAGIDIEAFTKLEAANVLWDQGEMAASIGILQTLKGGVSIPSITWKVGAAELLAKLVRHCARTCPSDSEAN
jgi:ataxia telangiectasia mutated family protein